MNEKKWLEEKDRWVKEHPITLVIGVTIILIAICAVCYIHDVIWPPTPMPPGETFTLGEAASQIGAVRLPLFFWVLIGIFLWLTKWC